MDSAKNLTVWQVLERLDLEQLGSEMFDLARNLYPICRSITGDGVRKTLREVDRMAGLELREVPSGSQFFDWTIPKEWNIRDAYVADLRGRKLVDFRNSNLHVLGYSMPFRGRVTRNQLVQHLYSDPNRPDAIPYRNSYYKENWGFCVSHEQLAKFTDDEYDVVIDSTLEDGHLTYGEAMLTGSTSREVLISTHVCHPSLANDNLSGIVVAAMLARQLRSLRTRYSYRFLFVPCTIGPIAWLGSNPDSVACIDHGLVLACLGDSGRFTYVRSRRDTADIDRIMQHVLKTSGRAYQLRAFEPYGYDQRQYCSPGFNLAVGCLMRTPNGEYPEYHTSADNLDLLTPRSLSESLVTVLSTIGALEDNKRYLASVRHGEPHLGRRGLYEKAQENGLFWLLNYSDGSHDLLDIAERSGMSFQNLSGGVRMLEAAGLLNPRDPARPE